MKKLCLRALYRAFDGILFAVDVVAAMIAIVRRVLRMKIGE